MTFQPAPLIIFTYKRADTLRTLIGSLLTNNLASKTSLYIFSDGPKNESDHVFVQEVRDYIITIRGFERTEHFFSERNLGLAA